MKKTFLKSILSLIILFVMSCAGDAQAPQESPESVAKAYFAAVQAGDWAKWGSFMHNDALASVKRLFAEAVNADKTGDAAKTIFKLRSAAEYTQLSEAAVFERLMDFITSVAPEMKADMAASTDTVLGKVDENPDLVHIVYRTRIKLAGGDTSEVGLISLKKQGSTWRALLTPELEEMFNNFAEEIAPASKEEEKSAPSGAGRPPRRP